jgi:hypothetical protein
MKSVWIAVLGFVLPASIFGGDRLWLVEHSDAQVIRQVDYRSASRIEIAGDVVRLLKEQDGKLVAYFDAKSPEMARQIKAQLGYNAVQYAQVGESAYVPLDQVVSFEFQKSGDGELYILRGFFSELGRASDRQAMVHIRSFLKR